MMPAEEPSASALLLEELETIVARLREELGLGPSRLTDAAEKLRGDKDDDGTT